MSNVSQWSTTAASNNSAAPDGAPEGMAPSGVNDTIRENMAANARWYTQIKGSLVTTGSADSYVLSTGSSHAALADIGLIVAEINVTNTGATTLNVDTLGAKSVVKADGTALAAGDLTAAGIYAFAYESNNDRFILIGGGLRDVVSDTTPQLGGNLDVNGNEITSASDGDVTIHPNGTGGVNLYGEVLKPEQPGFLVYLGTDQSNATGTGATGVVKVQYDTEVFDNGADFDSTTNYRFTAPVTGKYSLNVLTYITGITSAADDAIVSINTSNRTYTRSWNDTNDMPSVFSGGFGMVVDMDVNDTAHIEVRIRGEASDVCDILAGSGPINAFSGWLVG